MLCSSIFILVLVVAQVVSHPSYFTVDDGNEANEDLSIIEPFEMTNPSGVEGHELYQSDMLLSEEQYDDIRNRKAIDNERRRWPEGPDGKPLVPYVFLDSVDQDDVRAGIDHWMEHTCINFEETTNTDQPHLQFHIGTGCWSVVGMRYWANGQLISIGNNCNSLGIVVHEIGHALGFNHEQSRSDRDDYVTIIMDNVKDGKENNFDLEDDNHYNVPYDYSSNMHYGSDYFSVNNLPTIATKNPFALELIGSRNGLSHRDKLLANKMYNCTGRWSSACASVDKKPCGINGGYIGKDCTCVCPPGSTGPDCKTIVDDYYAHLHNPLSEEITTEKIITVDTPMEADTKFFKWIAPPLCHIANVTLKSLNMYPNCKYQYLNVKTDAEDVAGQTMCAADVSDGVFLTSDTGIVITMINQVKYKSQWTLWTANVTFEHIPGCSDPVLQTRQYNLTNYYAVGLYSPNYPTNYGPANLEYKFTTLAHYKLYFRCYRLDLHYYDKLIVNGKPYIHRFQLVISEMLTITFKSNLNTSGRQYRWSCSVGALPAKYLNI